MLFRSKKAAADAMKPGGFELDDLAAELARQSVSGPSASITMTVWYEHYGGDVQSVSVIFWWNRSIWAVLIRWTSLSNRKS